MGLLERARSLSRPVEPARGLLQRSLAFLKTCFPTSAEKPGPAPESQGTLPAAEELSYRIAAIPVGFATPVLLFSLLRKQLGLERAVLLLYDARRHVFAPWASAGLDTTSRHRLRLPPGATEEFNRAAGGESVRVSGQSLESFREYFSSREFSMVAELLLVPFLLNQRLIALLLVASREQPLTEETLAMLEEASSQAAAFLYDPAAAETRAPETGARPLAERVEEQLAACRSRGQPLLLLRLHLEALERSAQARAPELEPFRLQEFLLSALDRLLKGIGWVEPLPAHRVLLVVHGMQEADPALLLRMLECALLKMLRGLVEEPPLDLRPEFRIVTEDPSQALGFLSERG